MSARLTAFDILGFGAEYLFTGLAFSVVSRKFQDAPPFYCGDCAVAGWTFDGLSITTGLLQPLQGSAGGGHALRQADLSVRAETELRPAHSNADSRLRP